MTKISFDVDFSKDPEKILQEIQERAKAEVEKRENKERNAAYLSKLHENVNEKIGTDFKSVSDLIKALTPFAAPSLRDKLSGTTASGRRKTVSMTQEIYHEVKKLLSESNPNKAAIARQTGISVVQVRKVAEGGFDSKFDGSEPSKPEKVSPPSFSSEPTAVEEVKEEIPLPPPVAEIKEPEEVKEEPKIDSTPLPSPSFGDDSEDLPPPAPMDLAPPPISAPSPLPETDEKDNSEESSLPPLPKFDPVPENTTSDSEPDDLPPPPSFTEEEKEEPAPPPPVDLAPPPAPDLPPPPSFGEDDAPTAEEESPAKPEIPEPVFDAIPPPAPAEEDQSESNDDLPPLPSFGDEPQDIAPPPPPAPIAEEVPASEIPEPVFDPVPPPAPDLPPPAPEVVPEPVAEEPPAPPSPPPAAPEPPAPEDSTPPSPPSAPAPAAPTPKLGLTRPPSGGGLKPTLKPKLGGAGKGKPTLSLKPKAKGKTTGLKITRPPMRGNPPPSQ